MYLVGFVREVVGMLLRGIREAEATEKTGFGYFERTTERMTQRNGYRNRS